MIQYVSCLGNVISANSYISKYTSNYCQEYLLFNRFLEIEDQTTPAPPRLHYDIEVKLVNLGDGFMAPTPDSPDFEVISNRISESFGPVFEKLPGYYQIRLNELRK